MNIQIIYQDKVIQEYDLRKGQTYSIPEGYKIVHKEISRDMEKTWIEKE